ncbi:MAG: hypothetical protein F6J93_11095 [Oscillatoria sp. SIO1A7]|nr:hypothetical protein [Oscillatoria sp. SIO1A7]
MRLPWLIGQPDGTFAIASVEFKNVFLRMAGNGVTEKKRSRRRHGQLPVWCWRL